MVKKINVRRRGMALIIVLIAVAIMVASAATITSRFNRVLFITTNANFYDRAWWYVAGIEGIAMKYMKDDFKKTPTKVYLGMNWAQPNQVIPLDEAIITGTVKDEMACFNINSLATDITYSNETSKERDMLDQDLRSERYQVLVFRNLLEQMGADATVAQTISDSAVDWIDTDNNMRSSMGAEDQFYLAGKNPHLTSRNRFYDKSELRSVHGMTAELYRRIEPMICALPEDKFVVSINTLNYRQAPLLSALFLGHLPLEEAVKLIENRPNFGWDSYAGFFREDGVESRMAERYGLKTRLTSALVVNSNYFVMNITVKFNDDSYAFVSRIKRESDSQLMVYQRFIGELYE